MPAPKTYGLHTITDRFGVRAGTSRRAKYMASMIERFGFPKPFPTFVQGKGIVTDIRANTQWPRDPVDAWFAEYDPPASAALERRELSDAAERMDRRCDNITFLEPANAA